MLFNSESVRIDTINTDDTFYRVTTNNGIEDLSTSIKSIGLLQPPILIKKNKTYHIISGFRRIDALRSLDYSNVDAWILDDTEDIDAIRIAISENSYQRALNIIEKAQSVRLLSTCIHHRNELLKMTNSVNIPCDAEFLSKLLKIAHLNKPIQEGILHGYVSMSVGLYIGDYDDTVSNLYMNIFKKLTLGLNRQRELISLVNEISKRDDVDPVRLLKDSIFREVMGNYDLDGKQKIQILFRQLNKIRYPEISKAEANFIRCIKDLRLGKGIQLMHPRQFEDINYVFQLTFKDLNEIKSIISHLEQVINDPKFKRIFDR